MFRGQTDKYSVFDDKGLPTHSASGEQLSDSQKKKLYKQWGAQDKKHKEYLARK